MAAKRTATAAAGAVCRVVYIPVFGSEVGLSAATYGGKQAEYKFKTAAEIWKRVRTEGRTWTEKLNVLGSDLQGRLVYEWQLCEAAPQGTFKNYIVLASKVLLSRLHEDEMFLKSIPVDVKHVQVQYPASLNVEDVKNKIETVATNRKAQHTMWWRGNIALMPILIIIGFLPAPNLPLYWSIFRLFSHSRVIRSANTLLQAEQVSDRQLLDSDPSGTASEAPTGQDLVRALSHRQHKGLKDLVTISYSPSSELDQAVQPIRRETEPMSLPLAKEIGEKFDCANIFDTVLRIRRRLGLSIGKTDSSTKSGEK